MNRHDITVGDVRSPVLDAGAGREAAVFVHGNPGSGEDWQALVEGAGSFIARGGADDAGLRPGRQTG